eukprot:scaffold54944_cov69-Phaeocystis_antarctica.AAC.4
MEHTAALAAATLRSDAASKSPTRALCAATAFSAFASRAAASLAAAAMRSASRRRASIALWRCSRHARSAVTSTCRASCSTSSALLAGGDGGLGGGGAFSRKKWSSRGSERTMISSGGHRSGLGCQCSASSVRHSPRPRGSCRAQRGELGDLGGERGQAVGLQREAGEAAQRADVGGQAEQLVVGKGESLQQRRAAQGLVALRVRDEVGAEIEVSQRRQPRDAGGYVLETIVREAQHTECGQLVGAQLGGGAYPVEHVVAQVERGERWQQRGLGQQVSEWVSQ